MWKASLRSLSTTQDLFHAHFGPAGLSPFSTITTSTTTDDHLPRIGACSEKVPLVAEGSAMRERLIALGAPPIDARHPADRHLDEDGSGFPRDDELPRVLMTGRLVEKKGFADGVAAFAEARRSRGDARLLILWLGTRGGAAPVRDSVARPAKTRSSSSRRCRASAFGTSCARAMSCYSRAALLRTATPEGGAPTTLLEAQALGRVVVATDHADIPNIVDRETALLAPEGDAEALADRLTDGADCPEEWASRGRRRTPLRREPTTAAATSRRFSSGSTIES